MRWLGDLLRDTGDWFYHRHIDWAAEILYRGARQLGANMQWPPKR